MSNNGVIMTTPAGSSNTSTVGESSNSSDLTSDPLMLDLTSELLGEDLLGICECGACTVSSFLQSIPCPRPSSIPALSLSFLEVSHLDGVQRQLLLGRLYLEYKAIVNRFSKLTHAIERFILEKKISFSNLSKTIAKLESFMPSLPQDEKVRDIRRAKTNNKLFALLPDDSSFLDYHVFEDIARELKNAELNSKVAEYKKFLEGYCHRGIFECPSFSPASKKGHSSFITELHCSRHKMTLRELAAIQEQVCGILGVVPNTICLCSSASKMPAGNIQVVFRVPDYVKDSLTPLNAEQESAMRELGFVGWSFYYGLDITYDAAQLANQLLATDSGLVDTSVANHVSLGGTSMANHIVQATAPNSAFSSDPAVANHIAAAGGHASNIQIQMPVVPDIQRLADGTSDDDDDDDEAPRKKLKPAPGKKTRGRVKIPMEYIKNKLRRYTTFSKRKSNIMKKAYELSTLTGTQVMLMVASETGHVYTFATPKLQPMITSDAGKALIQTCLHQPDMIPLPSTSSTKTKAEKQRTRMSSSGYEETDLGGYMQNGRGKASAATTAAINHAMPSVYTPPPPSLPLSLANELLPSGMLQSLVTSSHLPPPLISPEGYSPGTPDEEGEDTNAHSPGS